MNGVSIAWVSRLPDVVPGYIQVGCGLCDGVNVLLGCAVLSARHDGETGALLLFLLLEERVMPVAHLAGVH